MKVEMIDGVRVLKLRDRSGAGTEKRADDTMTTVHIWRLLSGGHDLRDTGVGPRRFL